MLVGGLKVTICSGMYALAQDGVSFFWAVDSEDTTVGDDSCLARSIELYLRQRDSFS